MLKMMMKMKDSPPHPILQIDDKEFDIPQVDTPPTLESILNEPEEEDEPFVLEDTCLLNTENIDAHSCETSSLASSDSGDRAHLKRCKANACTHEHERACTHTRRKAIETNATVHGSVLRHSTLKGVSAQIVSAAEKVDAGLPTAITVSGVIAVGTSHGLALVFDQNQALRLCLGTTAMGAEYGAVSALSINRDCTRLLCGFAKGQITMWDLANGKLLRTITDAHPPGTAILHVEFTDLPTLAVCNDSGGSVFELSFRRVMGMRTCESRCLFSGSKGEVCCVEPLHAAAELKDHPITPYCLLAMASLTKILVIGLKPSLKVWMTFPYGRSASSGPRQPRARVGVLEAPPLFPMGFCSRCDGCLLPCYFAMQTDPASVPVLAWQFAAVQKAVNPVVAFCRGDTVHFLLVKKDESGTIHVIKQRQLQLSCDLISLTWLNSRTLVLMDSSEKLHVLDRPSQDELETLDLHEVQLVYNSSHFKSLATGGNVSQALALVGERACYQSVCSYAGQIFYLGTKSVHVMTLRSWRERVEHFLKQERFTEALSLAWSFHEGTAKAVLGLFGDPVKRKAVVADKMVEILFQYVERSLKKCPEQGKIQVLEQHFQDMVPVVVDYCLLLQRTGLRTLPSLLGKGEQLPSCFWVPSVLFSPLPAKYLVELSSCRDLLFNQIYSRLLENPVARGVFLESLEPYILSERIGCLTAPVMRDLLSYFQENGMMESVEGCLVHMDITNLDIQQVVRMCWDNQLYDAMIYVFNSGMNDYISPMEKLFQVIGPPLQEGKPLTDEQVIMGNKLLVYISCSLAGRAYPLGDIPEDLVPQVKNQVFEFLIRLHTVESTLEEEVHPYIRTLLHFDTREFLNVLALTFEDFKNDKQALEYQQRIVDILLKVMVDNSDFTPSQVGCLFTFLARQLAKPDNTLFVNRKLFDQVLEFLCSPDDDTRHTERQQSGQASDSRQWRVLQVLLELLQVGGVVQFDQGRLLALAEKAEFYQICEFMYEQKHLYDRIIDCYLKDPLRKEEIYNYVHNILSLPGYSPKDKQTARRKALEHVKASQIEQELVRINPAKTAELVASHFGGEVECIITALQDDYLVFQLLKNLLDPSDSGAGSPAPVGISCPPLGDCSREESRSMRASGPRGEESYRLQPDRRAWTCAIRLGPGCSRLGRRATGFPSGPAARPANRGQSRRLRASEQLRKEWRRDQPTILPSLVITPGAESSISSEGPNPQAVLTLRPDLHELLVGLLCRFCPRQVTPFLQTSQHYRLEETIEITKKHDLREATSYLLEKKGDVQGAFQVLLQTERDKEVTGRTVGTGLDAQSGRDWTPSRDGTGRPVGTGLDAQSGRDWTPSRDGTGRTVGTGLDAQSGREWTHSQTLKTKLHTLTQENPELARPRSEDEDAEEADDDQTPLSVVEEALIDLIQLCHRNSHGLNQQQREALWFPLLEAMMSPQKLLKGPSAKHTSEALKELTMKVLNSMSSFIALPAIIQRILQDPVYGKGKLAEIQGLILGMLETFNYEQTLLETTTSLLNSDLHWSLAHLRKAVSRGLHPRQDHCNICLQQYKRRQESEEEIIIFSCGHLYHCQCLQRKEQGVMGKEPGLMGDGVHSWSCYKCTSRQGTRPADRVSVVGGRMRATSLAQSGCSLGPLWFGFQTKVTSAYRGADTEAHGRKAGCMRSSGYRLVFSHPKSRMTAGPSTPSLPFVLCCGVLSDAMQFLDGVMQLLFLPKKCGISHGALWSGTGGFVPLLMEEEWTEIRRGHPYLRAPLSTGTLVYGHAYLRARLSTGALIYGRAYLRVRLSTGALVYGRAYLRAPLSTGTLIYGHAYLRAPLSTGTLIYGHPYLRARLSTGALIYGRAYLRARLSTGTLIYGQAYLRAPLSTGALIYGRAYLRAPLSTGTLIYGRAYLRAPLSTGTLIYGRAYLRARLSTGALIYGHAYLRAPLSTGALIYGHPYLRARLSTGTLIYGRACLRVRLSTGTLVYGRAYLRARLSTGTLIYGHPYLRARLSTGTLIYGHAYLRAPLSTGTLVYGCAYLRAPLSTGVLIYGRAYLRARLSTGKLIYGHPCLRAPLSTGALIYGRAYLRAHLSTGALIYGHAYLRAPLSTGTLIYGRAYLRAPLSTGALIYGRPYLRARLSTGTLVYGQACLRAPLSTGTLVYGRAYLRARLSTGKLIYGHAYLRARLSTGALVYGRAYLRAHLSTGTLIYGRAYLRARLSTGTLVYGHAYLRAPLSTGTLIYGRAYLRARLSTGTLIYGHPCLRARLSTGTLIYGHPCLRVRLSTGTFDPQWLVGVDRHDGRCVMDLAEVTLDSQQIQAWDQLRCMYRGPSRLAILTDIGHSHSSEKAGLLNTAHPPTGSIYHSENFSLKLSPPPVVEE
ncbi:hypothetical protein P4O66_021538 [Electrophorus voltai]|uniref:RING-type domain-containing protein n=1 Tax=Electrophorus voltai TaxID=2609070 RepID=A0AAD8ZPA7_9TELE|nr:hypothetical protein P4O66_021538 [Electrophorus voltai]